MSSTTPVESVTDSALGSHELVQQQQGLHSHPKGCSVDHLEQGVRVALYERLDIICGYKGEGTPHAGYDGTQDASINFFCLQRESDVGIHAALLHHPSAGYASCECRFG